MKVPAPAHDVAEVAAAATGSLRRAAVALRDAKRDAEKAREDMVPVRTRPMWQIMPCMHDMMTDGRTDQADQAFGKSRKRRQRVMSPSPSAPPSSDNKLQWQDGRLLSTGASYWRQYVWSSASFHIHQVQDASSSASKFRRLRQEFCTQQPPSGITIMTAATRQDLLALNDDTCMHRL